MSPVIATMLLLAITVTLTGLAFVLFSSSLQVEKAPPSAQVSVQALDSGWQVVTITQLSEDLNPDLLRWEILPPSLADGNVTRGAAGQETSDGVYGLVGANVSFFDRDAAYTVNSGDWFVINSTALNTGTGDWTFRLFYQGTGTQLAEVSLPIVN